MWCRPKSYPFWPARIVDVVPAGSKPPVVSVVFFGDDAWERVKDINATLRTFHTPQHEVFCRQGNSHPHGGDLFRQAVRQAVAYEAQTNTADNDHGVGAATAANSNAAPPPLPCDSVPTKLARTGTAKLVRAGTPNGRVTPPCVTAPTRDGAAEPTPSSEAIPAADDAEGGGAKAPKECSKLAFSAPGRKNESMDLSMTARERRRIARALELISTSEAMTSSTGTRGAASPAVAGGKTLAKLLANHRVFSCDVFSAPTEADDEIDSTTANPQ